MFYHIMFYCILVYCFCSIGLCSILLYTMQCIAKITYHDSLESRVDVALMVELGG